MAVMVTVLPEAEAETSELMPLFELIALANPVASEEAVLPLLYETDDKTPFTVMETVP